ncbi:MAG: hypothetical protein QNJ22_02310 [Desulfosarcinaceae bacterium]|nr:hypothetical protein [Desulfosarcinaceae bacterium]
MRIQQFSKRRSWPLLVVMMGYLLLLSACGTSASAPEIGNITVGNGLSDEYEFMAATGVVPTSGAWEGSQIRFQVSTAGTLIESIEISYSGRASNENCDFDYSDVVTAADISIQDGKFVYDSDTLVIDGRFTATQEAEVTVLWFGYYGGACEVFYNGELTSLAAPTE